MGGKKRGDSDNVSNNSSENGEDFSQEENQSRLFTTLRNRTPEWVSGVGGGLAGGVATILFLILPSINTWIANVKEISLAQVKTNQEQIDYVVRRMEDSDKERDLYKQEMLTAQKELRACQTELSKVKP